MNVVQCRVCNRDMLEDAKKCPHCDSLSPKRHKRVMWFMGGLVVVLAIVVGLAIYFRPTDKKRTRDEIDAIRRAEKIHQRIMSANFLLRTSVSNIDSITIGEIKTNIDGSILCYWYSEKDSNGKAIKKKAVFAEGDFHHSEGAWGIYCQPKNLIEIPPKPEQLN